MPEASDSSSGGVPTKPTGPLVDFSAASAHEAPLGPIPANLPDRNFFLRFGELMIFLVAVVGAVALGLAITTYFRAHTYIAAYLLAYAGFRAADLLVRDDYGPDPARDAVIRRVSDQGPLLLLFFAAPFERTFLWGGEAPHWMSGLALAMELGGLWLALGARIQLGFFSTERRNGIEEHVLVRNGFYRFVRHPTYSGVSFALIAWPIAYGAPISVLLSIIVVGLAMQRLIQREERTLIDRYGEEYVKYQDASDAMIPSLW